MVKFLTLARNTYLLESWVITVRNPGSYDEWIPEILPSHDDMEINIPWSP